MFDTSKFFDNIFNNSSHNGIIIMDAEGIVQQVNEAFSTAYGYRNDDLQSKHFRVLYTEKDQTILRPEIELNMTHRQGNHTDENYLVHKDGTPIWVTGEAVLVTTDSFTCIVKIIHNIHAQKQLERYLLASSDLLDSLFNSVQSGLLLLDSQIRVIKTNAAFNKIFSLDSPPREAGKIQDIPHSFWREEEVKNDLRNAIVHNDRISKEYIIGDNKSNFHKVHIRSKFILGEDTPGKRLLLVVKEV